MRWAPWAWALILSAVAGPARAADLCAECHARASEPELRLPAEQVPKSAHRHPAIGCVGCHGGDPDDPTVRAHAPERGYIGRPGADRIASLCGGCHGDARFVRRLNASLPIDQLVLYGPSRHGVLAATGDGAAPVCTTCHGHHEALPVADPRSPVHPRQVAELCGSCHADPEHMAAFQSATSQLAHWKRSAHAEALERGLPRAPTCTGCHGNHGEMPAEVASVARGCASCHSEQLDYFARSAHAKPFQKQGFAECVPCHGTHDVPPAQPLLLGLGPDGACSACHAEDEDTKQTTRQLAEQLQKAAEHAGRARGRVEQATRAGLQVRGSGPGLAALHTAEIQLKPVVHALASSELEAPLQRVHQAADAVEQLVIQAEQSRRAARRAMAIGVGLLALLFILLLLKAIRLARRAPRGIS